MPVTPAAQRVPRLLRRLRSLLLALHLRPICCEAQGPAAAAAVVLVVLLVLPLVLLQLVVVLAEVVAAAAVLLGWVGLAAAFLLGWMEVLASLRELAMIHPATLTSLTRGW
jgi:hypothetical protein